MIYCNWPVKSGKLSGTGGAANAVPVPDRRSTYARGATMADASHYQDSCRFGKPEHSAPVRFRG